MTNKEWVQTLNEEELARFLEKAETMEYDYRLCEHCEHWDAEKDDCLVDYDCELTLQDWLRAEHE